MFDGGLAMLNDRYANNGISILELNQVQKKYITQFKEKLSDKIYLEELSLCMCGGDNFEILSEKDRYGIPMKTVVCRNCGLVMTNPHLSSDSFDSFYNFEYNQIYRGTEEAIDYTFDEQVFRGGRICDFVEKTVSLSGKRILEIGCSTGGIVRAFEQRGCDAHGIDLSQEYIEYGRKKGVQLECCTVTDLAKRGEIYDIIILSHVLEHFVDLKKNLDNIKKILNTESGYIYIGVPGIKYLYHSYEGDFLRLIQNAHVYIFSRDTLNRIMSESSFVPVYVTEQIQGIYRLTEAENVHANKFDNQYDNIMQYLIELEEHRDCVKELFYEKVKNLLSEYGNKEVAIYGTGNVSTELINNIGEYKSVISGFLTNDDKVITDFLDFPILQMDKLDEIKLIIIASFLYQEEIYFRIKYLEESGIKIVLLSEIGL